MSASPYCTFVSCPSRTLELNATDPVTLPCDSTTPVNTNDTVAGNYSYCNGNDVVVNRSTGYHTFEFNYMHNGATICCYNHDQDTCGVCFDLTVYCKCICAYQCLHVLVYIYVFVCHVYVFVLVICDLFRCS